MQNSTFPFLVYLRDKALISTATARGFLCTGSRAAPGSHLVIPSDHLSAFPNAYPHLPARCHDFGGTPVFYKVSEGAPAALCGLRLYVRQARRGGASRSMTFTVEGSDGSQIPQGRAPAARRTGATFRAIPPCGRAGDSRSQLRAVRTTVERVGRLPRRYFRSASPMHSYLVSLSRRGCGACRSRVVAFANVWPGPGRGRNCRSTSCGFITGAEERHGSAPSFT